MTRRFIDSRAAQVALLSFYFSTCALISNSLFAQSESRLDSHAATLTTYLLLDGQCRQAMEFYQSCLGGELALTTVADSPMKKYFPENMHGKIVNARLISEKIDISASDWLRPSEVRTQGNNVCLYLNAGSFEEIKVLFDRLSVGAQVTDPLRDEPFGTYGALNDKFGIRWMFHVDKGK